MKPAPPVTNRRISPRTSVIGTSVGRAGAVVLPARHADECDRPRPLLRPGTTGLPSLGISVTAGIGGQRRGTDDRLRGRADPGRDGAETRGGVVRRWTHGEHAQGSAGVAPGVRPAAWDATAGRR